MAWELANDRPIYLQLLQQIQLRIASGFYLPGEKLPSVRDLASEASVNPNTMQKALSELERQGLLYSQRTAGRYITEDEEMIRLMKEQLALQQVQEFFARMQQLGFDIEQTVALITKQAEEMK
ncbi:MAG: GntR family transcriptional regulator, partial [Oscillospiraceae bacterium]